MSLDAEDLAWFDALDDKCKIEAVVAGYSKQQRDTRPAPITIINITMNQSPFKLVITRPPSNFVNSCKSQLRKLSKTSLDLIFTRPREPDTASRYRSPSPETICCGLITLERPEMVYV